MQVGTVMGGGVSSVIDLIIAEASHSINVEQRRLITHQNGRPLAKALRFIRGFYQLLRDLNSGRTDLYHVHFSTGASTIRKIILVGLIALFGKPVVGHSHGGRFKTFYDRQLGPFGRLLVRRFLTAFDRIIVLSPEWKTFFESVLVDDRHIVVIANAVKLRLNSGDRRQENVRVLALGALSAQKGTTDLIAALAKIATDLPQLHVDLAGDGDLAHFQAIAMRAGIQDRVTFHGWVDGSAREDLISGASIFALPSYAEGLPMALLEGMATGLPVIVTPVGGIPSLIEDGLNGVLINPGDVDALATALKRLADDAALRNRLGDAARASVERSFGAQQFAAALRVLYDDVLAARHRA